MGFRVRAVAIGTIEAKWRRGDEFHRVHEQLSRTLAATVP